MPVRNVVPKPVQKPHPPLWVACSRRETIHLAAKLGIGALTFAFVSPEEARTWVTDYYTTLENECEPIGYAINANIAIVTGFMCDENAELAHKMGEEGLKFFSYALGHHYAFGKHEPGKTNIWNNFKASPFTLPGWTEPTRASARRTRFARGCASSRKPALTRSCSSRRPGTTSMRTSARRSTCSPRR